MENITKHLLEFGLSELEASIYEKSVSLGLFASSNIANKLKIPRSTARYTCESLVKKGFMTQTLKGNTKYFKCENPTKLFSIIYNEEEKLKRKKNKVNELVSELQKSYNPNAKLPKITVYEGVEQIEKMFDTLADSPGILYTFGAGDYIKQKYEGMIKNFRNKAYKIFKEIMIFRSPKYAEIHKDDDRVLNTKYFKHIEELKVDIQIVDDKMTITCVEDPHPVAIMITHKEIINAFKEIFIETWKRVD
ncbi:MAG: helix-turn-helix domain-containing protein [Candidatus Gracilibacteria bacterium]|nr:helix-turn-helix domain-containing protein [Candidatus Gracilibacteria bacterium]